MNDSPTAFSRYFLVAAMTLLAACTSLQGGVGPLASPKAAQIVDLVYELNVQAVGPLAMASSTRADSCFSDASRPLELASGNFYSREGSIWKSSDIPNEAQRETQCLSQAQQRFNDALKDKDEDLKKAKRNSVQNRLLTASEQSCSLFKRYLNNTQSNSNFIFGAITTVTAGAAATVTNAAAAKSYAGAAAVVSGVGAEFNADMFSSQLAFVISKAIDNEREKALKEIRLLQLDKDKKYTDYPVEAAIADALRYHDKCSLYQGLQKIDDSIMIAKDPGLTHLTNLLGQKGELSFAGGKITSFKAAPEAAKTAPDAVPAASSGQAPAPVAPAGK